MNIEKYKIEHIEEGVKFQFVSEGPKGSIPKAVIFTKYKNRLFNLGFGDLNVITNKIDDLSISNNDDRQKILSTVAECVQIFLLMHPKCAVIAIGSTDSRTRLYQIAISKFYLEISSNYMIYGFCDENWELFELKGRYKAFLIRNLEVNED